MKIYLDLILILNFFLDLLLLISVSFILKRHAKFERLVLSSFIGGLSILLLFLNINSFKLFIFKIIISILMILIAFGFKSVKYFFNNILFLYLNSIVLGGFLYLINLNFSESHVGLVFINNGFSLNFLLLIILSPIIIYLYLKELKKIKNNYNNYYDVCIYLDNKKYQFVGYLDSANNLKFKNKPVILINEKKIKKTMDYSLVPYQGLNYMGFIKVIKMDKLVINGDIVNNCFLGLMENNLNIDGVDILLNNKLGGKIC